MALGSDLQEKCSIEYTTITLDIEVESKEFTISLIESFTNIKIVESIFEKLTTGSISFEDRDKFFDSSPLLGGEKLTIEFKDKLYENECKLEYEVYGYDLVSADNSQGQEVVVFFIDPLYKKYQKEYSTSFDTTKKAPSKFIEEFSKNVLGKTLEEVVASKKIDSIEETIAFPYQKFHYMLSYLNQYISSDKNSYIWYFYYSDLFNTYYKPFSSMLNKDIFYVFAEVTRNLVEKDFNNFSEYKRINNIDLLDTNINKGFGSTQKRWDSDNKAVISTDYKMSEVLSGENTLGNYNLYGKSNDSTDYVTYNSTESIKNKMIVLKQLFENSVRYSITLDGLIERSCGKLAYIVFQDFLDYNKEFNENKTGYYLIESIVHDFYKGAYTQNITLSRNGHLIQNSSDIISASNSVIK